MDPVTPIVLGLSLLLRVASAKHGRAAEGAEKEGLGLGLVLDTVAELAGHVGGHFAAEDTDRLNETFKKWWEGARLDKNQDLDRALARSALYADLFCLMEVLDTLAEKPTGIAAYLKPFWDRNPRWSRLPVGVLRRGERMQLERARDDCERKIRQIREEFEPVDYDPQKLIRPEQDQEYGTQATALAIAAIERKHGRLPDRARY